MLYWQLLDLVVQSLRIKLGLVGYDLILSVLRKKVVTISILRSSLVLLLVDLSRFLPLQ